MAETLRVAVTREHWDTAVEERRHNAKHDWCRCVLEVALEDRYPNEIGWGVGFITANNDETNTSYNLDDAGQELVVQFDAFMSKDRIGVSWPVPEFPITVELRTN